MSQDATSPERVGVVGAGRWGTALALVAARAGCGVTLLARRPEFAERVERERENRDYLPGIALPDSIRITSAPAALEKVEALLLAMPAQTLRETCRALAEAVSRDCPLVICAKGIETGSGLLMSEVAADCLPDRPLAALSGPSFAAEVARGLPTAASLACQDPALADSLAAALGSRHFRLYSSQDLIGVEIGGAVKNVIAIACGITTGRRLGDNARAALITRGLAEIARLGRAKGADPVTFMGLSGLGDLTLTCSASQSRNFAFGLALGEGRTMDQALAQSAGVVEGRHSAAAVAAMGRHLDVDMPIVTAVDRILNSAAAIDTEIENLLARPQRGELA